MDRPQLDQGNASMILAPQWPDGPCLRANMVVSIDGCAARSGGTSGALSGSLDRRLLSDLRATADVVLVGRATAHREGYRPIRARPNRPRASLAIVTSGARLVASDPVFADPDNVSLVTSRVGLAAFPEALGGVPSLAFGEASLDLRAAVAHLRGIGRGRIVCEGGPTLLTGLFELGLVDELCLTIAPVSLGDPDSPRLLARDAVAEQAWDLQSCRSGDGFVFLHYRKALDGSPV